VRFAEMTAPEIGQIDRDILVLIPVGSIEQHGPHLPVDTDTRLVTAIAEAMEEKEDILLAPTIWMGHSPHHLSFGGTLSAGHRLMADNMVQMARCFEGMGFRRLLFLNGHGGNNLPLGMVLQTLKEELPLLKCWACNYWQIADEGICAIRESRMGGMGHAGELETSLYMYLAPEKVRTEKIEDAGEMDPNHWFRTEMFLAPKAMTTRNFKEFTPTGVFGNPSLAGAEKGGRFFDAIITAMGTFIRTLPQAEQP
jgi:creatinine amidohydrolase